MASRQIRSTVRRADRGNACGNNDLTAGVRARANSLVDMMIAFLSEAGLDKDEIVAVLASRASRLRQEVPELHIDSWRVWNQLGDAVVDWWRDPRYVNTDGRPVPLPEMGSAPSVEALLSEHMDREVLDSAKIMLKNCVTVLDDGRWQFVYDTPALPLRGEQGVHRLQVLLTGLMRTFLSNSEPASDQRNKSFEKSAGSVSFPASMLPAFRARMKKCLDLAIEDADAWITRHSHDTDGEPVCEVGVEIFVFDFAGHAVRARGEPSKRSRGRIVARPRRRPA